MRHRALWALIVAGLVLAGPALAANFTFDCRDDRYVSRPLGTDMHQFAAPIAAVAPGNDSVDVIFEPHLPGTWFAQWCQTSTGLCFFDNQRIRLVAGVQDRLDIDIFPDLSTPDYGWVDITIVSVEDPLQVARCTYTLYCGLPVPTGVELITDCSDAVRYVPTSNPGDLIDFYAPVRNDGTAPDDMIVTMIPSVPGDWFAQFCQQSTGVCYFDRAEMPLPMGVQDSIHVQLFVGDAPSQGAVDFILQSKRNPSFSNYCFYRVYLGSWPQSTPEARPDGPVVRVVPNPSREAASILLQGFAAGGDQRVSIHGADGRLVRELGVQLQSGSGAVRWDGRDNDHHPVPSGIYFYRIGQGDLERRGTIIRTR